MSVTKVSNGWRADFRVDGRGSKRIRFTRPTKGEALNEMTRIQAAYKQKGNSALPVNDQRTLRDLIDEWYRLHGYNIAEGEKRYQKLKNFCQQMGNPLAKHFTSETYLNFRQQRLETGIAKNTANHDLAYLKAVFGKLIKLDVWKLPNPLVNVDKLTIDQLEVTYLETEEIRRLLHEFKNGTNPDVEVITRICLATGARWGEAEGLRGEQVRRQKIQFAATKNSLSRAVPISKELEDLIFDGRPKRGKLFGGSIDAFKNALGRANIELPKGQRSHVLRHSFAVHFMLNRGNVLDLQKILGHKTIHMTLRYAQFHPDYLQDAVTKNPLANL